MLAFSPFSLTPAYIFQNVSYYLYELGNCPRRKVKAMNEKQKSSQQNKMEKNANQTVNQNSNQSNAEQSAKQSKNSTKNSAKNSK